MNDPSRVRFVAPLDSFATGFAAELSRQGYTRDSACMQMRLMAHVSRWLADEGLDVHRLCAAEVERFLGDRRGAGYTFQQTEKALRPILTYLRQLGAVPPPSVTAPDGPVEELLERYRHYLTVERGLGGPTARGYGDAIRPFLQGRIRLDGTDFHSSTGLLVVRKSKFGKSRELPLHPTTVKALRDYLGRRERPRSAARTSALFVSGAGTRLLYGNVQSTFRRLATRAGLEPRSPKNADPGFMTCATALPYARCWTAIVMAVTRRPALCCCRHTSVMSTPA